MGHEDRAYLYSSGKYVLIATGIFIVSLIAGLIISIKNPDLSENYLDMFKQSLGWIKTLNPLFIMPLIFLNNALKSFLALILGIGFGVIPFLFLAGNGVILGILADLISRQQGVLFVIAATLPHGIIEVPVILISAGIGFRLGHVMYLSITGMRTDIRQELNQGVGFYIRRIVPLLFIAAAIETFITPLIVLRLMA